MIEEITKALANFSTEEQLVEMLMQRIEEYKKNPCKDTYVGVSFVCSVVMTKEAIKQLGSVEKYSAEIQKLKMGEHLMNMGNQ